MNPETQALIEFISGHSTPIIVYPREGPDINGWLTGGTGVLVETPTNRFLVTAEHVVAEIEALRLQHPIVVLLGGTHAAPVDVSDWTVIDRDKRLDICMLQIPEAFAANELNKVFYKVDFTDTSIAAVDDEALIIGFPRAHRTATGLTINTRMLPVLDFVTSVSELRFVMADPERERQILVNPAGLEVPEHMGGSSGAPVFRVARDAKSELIGIFTGGSDGLHGVYFCTHTKFLTNDGGIDSLKLPPS